ncbi:MAG: hypothetical protein RLZZ584_3381 [Pseudomonadota bacterium]|jgi:hypothetical protein
MSSASIPSATLSTQHIDLPLLDLTELSLWQRVVRDWRRSLSVASALVLALAVLPATLSS